MGDTTHKVNESWRDCNSCERPVETRCRTYAKENAFFNDLTLLCVRDMTHSYVRGLQEEMSRTNNRECILYDMTVSYVRYDSFIRARPSRRDVTHM